ncbi:MAG: M14 family metallopeptidase [Elusimicrobiota bacterium]
MKKILPILLALFAAGSLEPAATALASVQIDFDGSGGGSDALPWGKFDAPGIGGLTGTDDRVWVELRADGPAERTRIATIGMAIESVEGNVVGGVADSELLGLLQNAGIEIIRTIPLSGFGPEDFPENDAAFHNYGEAEAALKGLAAADPDHVQVIEIGKSLEGRAITALRFHGPGEKEKPGIVFFGAHHAREHLSTEVPLGIASWLAENRSRPEIAKLLKERDVYFVPMVNPDGIEYDIASGRYRWQRKNRRQNDDGSFGVDLNRNFDFRWGGRGASSRPGAGTYHGSSPFSEPESRAVRDFLTARPNIRIAVSYHSFSELIMYPWGGASEPISDGRALAAFRTMAQTMAGPTGYRPMQSADLYIATGDTCDWAWAALKVFCFTFELTPKSQWQGGFYPGAGAIDSTVSKNLGSALYLIDLADDPYRAGDGAPAAKLTTDRRNAWDAKL